MVREVRALGGGPMWLSYNVITSVSEEADDVGSTPTDHFSFE